MKKIMFSGRYGLEQAVLAGTKTMTRRLMTMTLHRQNKYGQLVKVEPNDIFIASDGTAHFKLDDKDYLVPKQNQPAYRIGEKVAIAQSYKNLIEQGHLCRESDGWICEKYCTSPGYYNKMFVKAEYMPWQIVIDNFRFERLQDICEADIMREGINEGHFMNKFDHYYYKSWGDIYVTFRTPRLAFASLIDHVCGRGTWDINPWVVAYSFHLQHANM